jgi:hypothetical protein
MNYYQIKFNVYHPEIWYLGNILGIINNWDLSIPNFYNGVPNEKLITHVRHGSAETDYTDAGYASIPCVTERAKNLLLTLPDMMNQVDFLLLDICNHTPRQPVYAMVIKLLKDCVDESQSNWSEPIFLEDETPTSRGFLRKYSSFFKLTIDSNRTDNCDIFRLEGSNDAIVSQRFKDLWQGAGLTGMSFSMGLNYLNL